MARARKTRGKREIMNRRRGSRTKKKRGERWEIV
jgi:hypothetical protein